MALTKDEMYIVATAAQKYPKGHGNTWFSRDRPPDAKYPTFWQRPSRFLRQYG